MGMVLLLTFFKIPEWKGIEDYVKNSSYPTDLIFQVCQATAFLVAIGSIFVYSALHFLTEERKSIYSFIGMHFITLFVFSVGVNYFFHFTVIPKNIRINQLSGLNFLHQWNTNSITFSLDNLGWMVFLPIALLLFSVTFEKGKVGSKLKVMMFICSCISLFGLAGYILSIQFLLLAYMILFNPIYFVTYILLLKYVKEIENK
jgi:hypothetical protein